MKKLSPILLSTVLVVMGLPLAALAGTQNTQSPVMPLEDILTRLDQAGYHQIQSVKYKDNFYDVEAYTEQCQPVEFRINAQNGEIPPVKKSDKTSITMLLVARRLQAEGYTRIEQIKLDEGTYKVEAYAANGKLTKLRVDPVSGKVTKEWF